MSLISEYVEKKLSSTDLVGELLRLIGEYNKKKNTYLVIYAAAIGKQIPAIALEQWDFFAIHSLLAGKKDVKNVDVYIETPGGSGEAAEEIVNFLHNHFDTVSFVISGEAKSAGTLMVLSGDEILMTETGSLGPIDAQIKIGRSVISAYDYMEWVEDKRKEAAEKGVLNPFDATMVAQITPGELGSVFHSLEFARDLVVKWLKEYKFKKWSITETRGIPVTNEMKEQRAKDIAKELTNHSKWRSHGRSIKITDLEGDNIKLKIKNLDKDPELSSIVYRIQIICKLLFETTTVFKIFATQEEKIFRLAMPVNAPVKVPQKPTVDVAELKQKCPNCQEEFQIYVKFTPNPQIDIDYQKKGFIPFPKDAKILCKCGFEIDLSGIKNQIEIQARRKIIV